MRYGVLLAIHCLLCFPGLATGQEQLVGPLGEPSRLRVRGITGMAPEKVARALFDDIDVAYASFANHPLAELKRLLVEKTVAGLRHSGFAQPHVTIADRLDHLDLNIEEGPRLLAGEIQIVGAHGINLQGIDVRKVAAELLPADAIEAERTAIKGSIWVVDRPARLDEPARQRLVKRVEELLAERGYPAAKFDLAVLGNRDRATLHIVIQDKGKPLLLGEIAVEGNHTRSSRGRLSSRQALRRPFNRATTPSNAQRHTPGEVSDAEIFCVFPGLGICIHGYGQLFSDTQRGGCDGDNAGR